MFQENEAVNMIKSKIFNIISMCNEMEILNIDFDNSGTDLVEIRHDVFW